MEKVDTLCWSCEQARGNGCSWFTEQTPVDGWKAVKQRFRVGSGETKTYEMTYSVRECPLFVDDTDRYNKPARRAIVCPS